MKQKGNYRPSGKLLGILLWISFSGVACTQKIHPLTLPANHPACPTADTGPKVSEPAAITNAAETFEEDVPEAPEKSSSPHSSHEHHHGSHH